LVSIEQAAAHGANAEIRKRSITGADDDWRTAPQPELVRPERERLLGRHDAGQMLGNDPCDDERFGIPLELRMSTPRTRSMSDQVKSSTDTGQLNEVRQLTGVTDQ
jgi:hypothetical protein